MNEYRFGVKGQERKALAGAISELLTQPTKYLGAPTFAYEIGGYHIDKEGTVTGEYDVNFFVGLAKLGFEPKTKPEKPTAAPERQTDNVCIEYPLDGFTPESLENLTKIVRSKEPLIKKALGMEELPIRMLENRICFDWFRLTEDNGAIDAYAQFITCLCTTAKEKKRVTAKASETFENEKFTMRVWLIGLGMIGKEYALARKLLLKNLSGNSSWRYGVPEKTGTVEAGQTVEEDGVSGDE
jgi:hypothetical protein